ncbi:hypothetical protein VPH35_077772 [Triticum aestivum]
MRLGLGTLGGSFPLALGGKAPLPPFGRRPPLEIPSPWAGAPPGGLYKGGEGGQQPTALGASLLPCNTSLSQKLGEALPETRYIHHHAVVLLDLHQPFLPPCWIKKEETSLHRTCVERGGAVRSALGHR